MSDRVGVMSQGVLQQVGTPMEIYNKPANGFVASFVGENNIFPGQRRGNRAGIWRGSRRRSGTFLTRLGPGIVLGGQRPGSMSGRSTRRWRPATPMASNSVPVEVADVAFEGNFIHSMPATSMAACTCRRCATIPEGRRPSPGAKLNLRSSRRECRRPGRRGHARPRPEARPMGELLRRYGGAADRAGSSALTAFWLLALVVLPYLICSSIRSGPILPVDRARRAEGRLHPLQLRRPSSTARSISTSSCKTVSSPRLVTASASSSPIRSPIIWPRSARPRMRRRCSCCLLIPLWVSEILRSFAWFIILAYQGPLNAFLRRHRADHRQPIRWITGFNGVIIGLVYTYVLFMLFPLYNAIQSLDTNQIEAARGSRLAAAGAPIGGSSSRMPSPASPRAASWCSCCRPARSSCPRSWPRPARAGSPRSSSNGCSKSQDWNTGSAYAFLLLLLCIVFVTPDDAPVQGAPRRHREMRAAMKTNRVGRFAASALYVVIFLALHAAAAGHHGRRRAQRFALSRRSIPGSA